MKRPRLHWFVSLLLVLATACSTATPVPTETPTPSATASATPVPTDTPAPTATFTPTPPPTATPTPAPTATPVGYYEHSSGFALVHPSNWELVDSDSQGAVIADPSSGLILMGLVLDGAEDVPIEALADEFLGGRGRELTRGEMRLADDITILSVDYAFVNDAGTTLTARLGLAPEPGRALFLAIIAQPETLKARAQTVNNILGTVRLLDRVYGLDRAQTLVFLGGEPDPEELDPARTTDSAASYAGHLFSGLVRLNPQLQIEADLAESWTVSPDGLTYTFTLRDGLTFQSGDPLTAEDVQYSWERAADPELESPSADTYLGDIVGVKDKLAGQADHIAGIEVIDARTLAVTLDAPKPYFLAKLTYPTAYVVNQANVEDAAADEWPFAPDASGPYGLREYAEGESVSFERNPAYHTPALTPYLVYRFAAGGAPLSLYEAGLIDVVGVYAEDAERIRQADDPLHAEWVSATSLCTSMLMLDNTQPPLDDVNVRRALALALDRDGLVEQFTNNLDVRAHTILPPGMPGYAERPSPYEFDVKAAREALAASTYAGQMPKLILNEGGQGDTASDFATAIVDMWRQNLGLQIEIQFLDPRDYTRAAREQHGQIVLYGWCADYPDPQNFLDILFHSASDFNVAGYTNAEVDGLLEQARTETDFAARLELYQQAEDLILADVGTLPWNHGVADLLVKPYLKNYVAVGMGVPIVHLLAIDASER